MGSQDGESRIWHCLEPRSLVGSSALWSWERQLDAGLLAEVLWLLGQQGHLMDWQRQAWGITYLWHAPSDCRSPKVLVGWTWLAWPTPTALPHLPRCCWESHLGLGFLKAGGYRHLLSTLMTCSVPTEADIGHIYESSGLQGRGTLVPGNWTLLFPARVHCCCYCYDYYSCDSSLSPWSSSWLPLTAQWGGSLMVVHMGGVAALGTPQPPRADQSGHWPPAVHANPGSLSLGSPRPFLGQC